MTNEEILQSMQRLSTTDLSDAMDRLGITGQCLGIMPLSRDFRLVGRAYTLHYVPVGQDRGSVGDFIDDLGPNDVVVIDNAGRSDATVWGDLLTMTAHRRNVAGTIIDGVCRDVDRSIELNYPIFSKGNWMRTGKDRVRVDGVNVPVSIGGVRVEPGDYLRGDGDGVVAIPLSRIQEVVEAAQEIHDAEEIIRGEVLSGANLRDARSKVGYHNLQTKQS
ncbi:RraA family protein [Bacillus sp. FJAT-29953]|nr:RraA family protein [Bacillus sp. FJAT-29953]